MDTEQAAEHLQVIRTLMERSALYRRTLTPIMLFLGVLGIAAAAIGALLQIEEMSSFGMYWFGVAVVAVAGAFLIARRQAFQAQEPFWSPPTTRVARALLPGLTSGFVLGTTLILANSEEVILLFVFLCLFFYGISVHAAGFFVPGDLQRFGWILIILGTLALGALAVLAPDHGPREGHLAMGFFFGVLHLAYGIYLRASDRQSHTA